MLHFILVHLFDLELLYGDEYLVVEQELESLMEQVQEFDFFEIEIGCSHFEQEVGAVVKVVVEVDSVHLIEDCWVVDLCFVQTS